MKRLVLTVATIALCLLVLNGTVLAARRKHTRRHHAPRRHQLQARVTAATKAGWWVRVNTEKTECSAIGLQIGTDKNNRVDWTTWHSGDPTEFDVPNDYLQVSELYINGVAEPGGKNAWFCMMYKTTGVKHFDFDDHEDHKRHQNDTDGECQ